MNTTAEFNEPLQTIVEAVIRHWFQIPAPRNGEFVEFWLMKVERDQLDRWCQANLLEGHGNVHYLAEAVDDPRGGWILRLNGWAEEI